MSGVGIISTVLFWYLFLGSHYKFQCGKVSFFLFQDCCSGFYVRCLCPYGLDFSSESFCFDFLKITVFVLDRERMQWERQREWESEASSLLSL